METTKQKLGCFSIILVGASLGILDGIMIIRGVDISRSVINTIIFLVIFFKAFLTFRKGSLIFQQENCDNRFQKGIDSIIIRGVSGVILIALNVILMYVTYFFVAGFIIIREFPR